jgi:hypothetical protein
MIDNFNLYFYKSFHGELHPSDKGIVCSQLAILRDGAANTVFKLINK